MRLQRRAHRATRLQRWPGRGADAILGGSSHALLAQLVVRLICNQKVGSSILSQGKPSLKCNGKFNGLKGFRARGRARRKRWARRRGWSGFVGIDTDRRCHDDERDRPQHQG